ncbi:MAG: thioesterase family protein [Rhodospirillales bacterium]|nr:thioesterase family protein [Rhodospirillales bacterium]
MDRAEMDVFDGPIRTYAAETMCRFRRPLSFPETVECGLRVERIGTTSVRFGLALFRQGEDEAAADGHWVHVFVDRGSERPAALPAAMRALFETLMVAEPQPGK